MIRAKHAALIRSAFSQADWDVADVRSSDPAINEIGHRNPGRDGLFLHAYQRRVMDRLERFGDFHVLIRARLDDPSYTFSILHGKGDPSRADWDR